MTNRHIVPAWLLILASFCLSLAIAVYCLARSHPPEIFSPFLATRSELVALTALFGSAPSFFYTLALGLLIGCCATARPAAIFHCLAWTGICLLLEVSQIANVSTGLMSRLGEWLPASSLQLVSPYWARGVFDPADLLATLCGGLLAALLIAHITAGGGNADV